MRRIGGWEIDPTPLGQGSFGTVFQACHSATRAAAAVKEIRLDRMKGNSKIRDSLEQEISVLSAVQESASVNIVRLLDTFRVRHRWLRVS